MPKPKPATAYILLFRGVGRATQLPVAPLRDALTVAGFENVATDINSGNAALRNALSREKVMGSVAKLCEWKFGISKAVAAPTLAEWDDLIANHPFAKFKEGKHVHAAVPASDPPEGAVEALRAHAVEGEIPRASAGGPRRRSRATAWPTRAARRGRIPRAASSRHTCWCRSRTGWMTTSRRR